MQIQLEKNISQIYQTKSLWYIDNCSYKTLDDSPEVFTNFLIGLILKVTKKHEDPLILMNYKISIRS